MTHMDKAATKQLPLSQKSYLRRLASQWDIQLMILPALLMIIVFQYIPMYGVLLGFQDYSLYKGFLDSPWVGFKHFIAFFNDSDFFRVMRNTIVISFLKLFIGFPAPILLALMLNEVGKLVFKRIIQTISYLPHFMSWVIVAGMVSSMLSTDNGSINLLLVNLNLIEEPVSFLALSQYFWSILVMADVWKNIGFGSIIYLAAIAGVNPQLYEAASIDGASRFKQIYLITIPSIMPVIIIFMILAIGNLLSAGFEDILLLASAGIREVSDVIDVYVYRIGIENQRYSYATAIGLFKAVISVALLTLANIAARRSGNSLW